MNAASPESLVVDLNDSVAEGLTVIMVYTNRQLHFFGRTTAALDELALNVVDARIVPTAG